MPRGPQPKSGGWVELNVREQVEEWWLHKVRTPRGVLTTVLALILWFGWIGSGSGAGVVGVVIFGLPICWFGVWLAFGLLGGWWERRTSPAVPSFARVRSSRGVGTMLKEDANAGFFHDRGFLFRRRTWFVGTGCPPLEVDVLVYEFLSQKSGEEPVKVAGRGDRLWWWFEGRFYWENQGLSAEDVVALVRQRGRTMERQLQSAHDLLAAPETSRASARLGIPEEVRRAVWRRDEGQCQNCGSTELLQFDHVIPVTMGGSSTVENLQLLCSNCNREKGGAL